MEEIKGYQPDKMDIESAIVDLNAQIVEYEQRMYEEGISDEEVTFLGQFLAGLYDELDRHNEMLSQFEDKSPVEEFREYKESKTASEGSADKLTNKTDDYMTR